MKKSTPFNSEMSDHSSIREKDSQTLPSSPKEQTIKNIMSFAKSYSVRKGKTFDKMEFNLN
jgi:cell envelope opacity-associated protein A